MNLKKCKKLRRIARMLTTGKPLCQYWPQDNRANEPGIHERMELFPECTRAVYRTFKKGGVPVFQIPITAKGETDAR